LTFEPLKTLKGQVFVDFIVEHSIDLDDEISYFTFTPWKLYFDGSVCKDGQGVVLFSSLLIVLSLRCQVD
jgi:hypothetical protein